MRALDVLCDGIGCRPTFFVWLNASATAKQGHIEAVK